MTSWIWDFERKGRDLLKQWRFLIGPYDYEACLWFVRGLKIVRDYQGSSMLSVHWKKPISLEEDNYVGGYPTIIIIGLEAASRPVSLRAWKWKSCFQWLIVSMCQFSDLLLFAWKLLLYSAGSFPGHFTDNKYKYFSRSVSNRVRLRLILQIFHQEIYKHPNLVTHKTVIVTHETVKRR